jgi:hypothetical protein
VRRDRTPDYNAGNTEAAEIILERPELYGEGLRQWAARWQAAHPPKVVRWQRPAVVVEDGPQMKLFAEASAKLGGVTLMLSIG